VIHHDLESRDKRPFQGQQQQIHGETNLVAENNNRLVTLGRRGCGWGPVGQIVYVVFDEGEKEGPVREGEEFHLEIATEVVVNELGNLVGSGSGVVLVRWGSRELTLNDVNGLCRRRNLATQVVCLGNEVVGS
jgi:hypothetical protein